MFYEYYIKNEKEELRKDELANKQKIFWFADIAKAGFDDAFFTFYCKNSDYKLNYSMKIEKENDAPFDRIKLDFLEILNYVKENDYKKFENFIVTKQHEDILGEEDENLFWNFFNYWNKGNYFSLFGNRGIGKTLHFLNTIVNFEDKIIGFSKERFNDYFDEEYEKDFLNILENNEEIQIVLIDSMNSNLDNRNEKKFNVFLDRILFIAKNRSFKLIIISPLYQKKLRNIRFEKLFFKNHIDKAEISIFKNCIHDNIYNNFLFSFFEKATDNPRSLINLVHSINKANKLDFDHRRRKDWSFSKYFRFINEYHIRTNKKEEKYISEKSWHFIKNNIVNFYQNKMEFSKEKNEEIQYLLKTGMIDVEDKKIILKDPFFSLVTLIFELLDKSDESFDTYNLGEKLIKKNIWLESSDEYNFLNVILFFEKWKRTKKENNDLFTEENYCHFSSGFEDYKKGINNRKRNETELLGCDYKLWSCPYYRYILGELFLIDLIISNKIKTIYDSENLKEIFSKSSTKKIINSVDLSVLSTFFMFDTLRRPYIKERMSGVLENWNYDDYFTCQREFLNEEDEDGENLIINSLIKSTSAFDSTKFFSLLFFKKILKLKDKNFLRIIQSLIIKEVLHRETFTFYNIAISCIEEYKNSPQLKKIENLYVIYCLLNNLFIFLNRIKEMKTKKELISSFASRNYAYMKELALILNLKNSYSWCLIQNLLGHQNYRIVIEPLKIKKEKFDSNLLKTISLFFNKSCVSFISHCLDLLGVEYSGKELSFEQYQIIEKILREILSFYPNLKIYRIDPHPKVKYIAEGHTMEKEDWVMLYILDQNFSRFKDKKKSCYPSFNPLSFGKIYYANEILITNFSDYQNLDTFFYVEESSRKYKNNYDSVLQYFEEQKSIVSLMLFWKNGWRSSHYPYIEIRKSVNGRRDFLGEKNEESVDALFIVNKFEEQYESYFDKEPRKWLLPNSPNYNWYNIGYSKRLFHFNFDDEIPNEEDLEVIEMFLFDKCEVKYLQNSFILICNKKNKLSTFDETFVYCEFLNEADKIDWF